MLYHSVQPPALFLPPEESGLHTGLHQPPHQAEGVVCLHVDTTSWKCSFVADTGFARCREYYGQKKWKHFKMQAQRVQELLRVTHRILGLVPAVRYVLLGEKPSPLFSVVMSPAARTRRLCLQRRCLAQDPAKHHRTNSQLGDLSQRLIKGGCCGPISSQSLGRFLGQSRPHRGS